MSPLSCMLGPRGWPLTPGHGASWWISAEFPVISRNICVLQWISCDFRSSHSLTHTPCSLTHNCWWGILILSCFFLLQICFPLWCILSHFSVEMLLIYGAYMCRHCVYPEQSISVFFSQVPSSEGIKEVRKYRVCRVLRRPLDAFSVDSDTDWCWERWFLISGGLLSHFLPVFRQTAGNRLIIDQESKLRNNRKVKC